MDIDENVPRGTGYLLANDGRDIKFTISSYDSDVDEAVYLATLRMTRKKAIEFANHILEFCKEDDK